MYGQVDQRGNKEFIIFSICTFSITNIFMVTFSVLFDE